VERHEPDLQMRFTGGMADYIAAIEALLLRSGARKGAATRRRAVTLVAAVVGGMSLARASAASDPDLSGEILAALRSELSDLVAD